MSAQVKVADADLLTSWQRKNKEYKQRHQLTAHREADTMARLVKFRQSLRAAKPEAEAKAGEESNKAAPTAGVCDVLQV